MSRLTIDQIDSLIEKLSSEIEYLGSKMLETSGFNILIAKRDPCADQAAKEYFQYHRKFNIKRKELHRLEDIKRIIALEAK